MKLRNRQNGSVSFWDIVIVLMVIVLGYLLYIRGYLNPYLPAQYLPKGHGYNSSAPSVESTVTPQGGENAASQVEPRREGRPAKPEKEEAEPEAQGDSMRPEPASPATQPEASQPATSEPATKTGQEAPKTGGELPAAPPIALAKLERRFWPVQVKLLKPMEFSIVNNGKVIGSANAPAGLMMKLVSIEGDQVAVQNEAMSKVIPAADTDIYDRVRAIMSSQGNLNTGAAPAAPAASATPWKPHLRDIR